MSAVLIEGDKETAQDALLKKQRKEQTIQRAIIKLHGNFNYSIRRHYEKRFLTCLKERLLDINYTSESNDLPVQEAIQGDNKTAFDKITSHQAFDPHKKSNRSTSAIHTAAIVGKEEYVETLLVKYKASVQDYCGRNLMGTAIEALDPFIVLRNSYWTYEGESTKSNETLAKRMESFYYRKDEFAPTDFSEPHTDGHSKPFPKDTKTIHAYYVGKTGSSALYDSQNIIGLLLSHGVRLDIPSKQGHTAIKLVENPLLCKEAFYSISHIGKGLALQYLEYEGDDVHKLKMQFWNCAFDEFVEVIVHYDMKPTKKLILAAKEHVATKEKELGEGLLKKAEDDKLMANERLANAVAVHVGGIQRAVDDVKKGLDVITQRAAPVIASNERVQIYAGRLKSAEDPVNKLRQVFFTQLSTDLHSIFSAIVVLSSDQVERKKNKNLDYVNSIIKGLGSVLPAPFSSVAAFIAKVGEFYSDRAALKRHKEINLLLKEDLHSYSKDIALVLTEWLEVYFNMMSTEKEAKTLAERVYVFFVAKLCDDDYKFNNRESISRQLIGTVIGDDAGYFGKLLPNVAVLDRTLSEKLRRIMTVPHHKLLLDHIHAKLNDFWNAFNKGLIPAPAEGEVVSAKGKAKVNLDALMISLEKMLRPVLTDGAVVDVRRQYSAYLHQMNEKEKIRLLNPASILAIAVTLTEMVIAKNADLSKLKTATELQEIAKRVVDNAVNSIFISLCAGNGQVINVGFKLSSWDVATQSTLDAVSQYKPLRDYLDTEPRLCSAGKPLMFTNAVIMKAGDGAAAHQAPPQAAADQGKQRSPVKVPEKAPTIPPGSAEVLFAFGNSGAAAARERGIAVTVVSAPPSKTFPPPAPARVTSTF